MEEIWKDIEGYEGFYQVSNLGRIKSLEKNIKRISPKGNEYTVKYPEKMLKQYGNHRGYLITQLSKSGKSESCLVHRIVAQAFIPNYEDKAQINHKNCNKQDNRIENLEWVTNNENRLHAMKNGLCKGLKGKENPNSKKVNQYDLNGKLLKQWECMSDIARYYKVKNVSNISECCKRRKRKDKNGKEYYSKTAYGYIWRYVDED